MIYYNTVIEIMNPLQEDKEMSEANFNSVNTEDTDIGNIHISDEVVAVIAGIAATEVEGVDSLVGNITNEIVSRMGIINLSKGIRVKMADNTVSISVTINIVFGYLIPDISRNVQEKVIQAIETMTNLSVAEVNVCVNDIIIEKK